jgi:hypothetical protein
MSWYSDIALSIQQGQFQAAGVFRANEARSLATRGKLIHPNENIEILWQKP